MLQYTCANGSTVVRVSYLGVVTAPCVRRVPKVTTATDSIHGVSLGIRVIAVVCEREWGGGGVGEGGKEIILYAKRHRLYLRLIPRLWYGIEQRPGLVQGSL